jgi:hypothetical protein
LEPKNLSKPCEDESKREFQTFRGLWKSE